MDNTLTRRARYVPIVSLDDGPDRYAILTDRCGLRTLRARVNIRQISHGMYHSAGEPSADMVARWRTA